jgi:hypothetical protein
MGLFDESNWRARWIAGSDQRTPSAPLPIFRRSFHLDQPIERAIVFLCGLGQHELRINGNKVGDDFLSPGWTNYRKTCLYVAYDITSRLQPGENVIAVMLGDGMYNVAGNRYRKFKGTFGPPKLICHLRVEHGAGSTTIIVSDSSWRTSPGPITFSCIYGGEDYNARLEQVGWDALGFDDSAWLRVIETDSPGGQLVAQASPSIRLASVLKPAHFARPRADTLVYDLGRNFAGIPAVTVIGAAGTKITMQTGELVDSAGLVTQKNTGSPVSFSYTLRGGSAGGSSAETAGVESWHPCFSYTGFRYIQVDGAPPMDLEAWALHSAARPVGRFSCSHVLLNRIHDLIVAAIASNLQSVLTDCPHREKLGWLEQHHLMASSVMFNFDVATFYEKTCRDIRDAQHDDGCVPTIAPEYVVFKGEWADFSNSPEWGSAVVLSPWQAFQHYGDRRILEENYDAMLRYIRYLRSREDGGTIEFGLGDWYDIGAGEPGLAKLTSKALTATAIYFHDVATAARIATILHRSDDAENFRAHARRIKDAFNQRFFDASKHQYDRGSQTAQAIPLALGMIETRYQDGVREKLIRDIRRHENHITCGDIGFRFLLEALTQGGRSDVIYDLLARTDPPSYGSQLERGATTLTEAWDANPRNSQNHLMLGHAEAWFWESLAGIRIDFSQSPPRQIVIAPALLTEISWVAASHESVRGPISIRWQRQPESRARLTVATPVASTIVFPASDPGRIREGRKAAHHVAGVRSVGVEQGQTHLQIEAGEYVFQFPV